VAGPWPEEITRTISSPTFLLSEAKRRTVMGGNGLAHATASLSLPKSAPSQARLDPTREGEGGATTSADAVAWSMTRHRLSATDKTYVGFEFQICGSLGIRSMHWQCEWPVTRFRHLKTKALPGSDATTARGRYDAFVYMAHLLATVCSLSLWPERERGGGGGEEEGRRRGGGGGGGEEEDVAGGVHSLLGSCARKLPPTVFY
jgi:hypothetical protein